MDFHPCSFPYCAMVSLGCQTPWLTLLFFSNGKPAALPERRRFPILKQVFYAMRYASLWSQGLLSSSRR